MPCAPSFADRGHRRQKVREIGHQIPERWVHEADGFQQGRQDLGATNDEL